MLSRSTEMGWSLTAPVGSGPAEEEGAPMREVQTPVEGSSRHHLLLPVVVGVVFVMMLVAGAMLG